jgi:hypothetical protein
VPEKTWVSVGNEPRYAATITVEGTSMQRRERSGQIIVLVIDETYGHNEDTWEVESEQYRINLCAEFKADFEESNVGPGADIPAFLTDIATTAIPLWTVLVGAFFLGKPINENLDGWSAIGQKIRTFFKRPVILARHGASVLAVEAVFDHIGGLPKVIKLISYRPMHIGDPEDLMVIEASDELMENTDTINLGYVRHIFEVEADSKMYRVSVLAL